MANLQKDINNTEVVDNEDTLKGKYLTFFIDNVTYAIEIKFVTEIIGIQPITEIPELPSYVKGIINLRGKIVPVMDVRLRFKKEQLVYNDRTCIVVVDVNGISLGLIVDNVSDVIKISDENIVPPPESSTGSDNKYIKSIGKVDDKVSLILSCEKLMSEDDTQALSKVV